VSFALAAAIFIGFVSIPVSVLAGVLKLHGAVS
jgi:hypothetical protein